MIQVHLDPLAVKSVIKNYLLQPLGLAYETFKPEKSHYQVAAGTENHDNESDCPMSSTWQLDDLGLWRGWYMLEVEHSRDTIGCSLSFETFGDHTAYLLLTSKRVCKRIVYLERKLTKCVVSINQPLCSLERLSLTALTSRFAKTRMKSRLANRGSFESAQNRDAEALYAVYQTHIHDGMVPRRYRPEAVGHSTGTIPPAVLDERRSSSRLILICQSERGPSTLDKSVNQAIVFARQHGWSIEWHRFESDFSGEPHANEDSRVFIMQILPGVEYRIDVFAQMLSVLEHNSVLVYADHDYVDDTGTHLNPILKPEWNPEFLLNTNYVQLPWMISESWASSGFSTDKYSSEWFDLVLLSLAVHSKPADEIPTDKENLLMTTEPDSERSSPEEIPRALTETLVYRVPKVLASVLLSGREYQTKAIDSAAWRQSLQTVLRRAANDAEITDSRYSGQYRILWPLPAIVPSVDIIIPTRDQMTVLKKCIESVLHKTSYGRYRILVVDNDSCESATERYYETLGGESCFSVLRYPGEFNYSAINNFAASKSTADVLVLLNNDTEVIAEHWLDELVRQAIRPDVGCVGAKLYYSNGRIQHGGVIVGIAGVAGHAHRYSQGTDEGYCGRLMCPQSLTAVTGACLAVKRSVFVQAGGLDEEHLAVAWNDVDFCLKVKALGYRNVWSPHAELYHHEGLSRGADDTSEKIMRVESERQLMMERWKLETFKDPAYHPLLTRDNEGFGLGKSISDP